MSGPELAERLRGLRPEMRVLFVSGYTDGEIVRDGELEPGTDFLQKPFTREQLAAKCVKCYVQATSLDQDMLC